MRGTELGEFEEEKESQCAELEIGKGQGSEVAQVTGANPCVLCGQDGNRAAG